MVIYLINVGTFINIVQFRHSWLANVSSRLETHSSSTIVVVVSSVFTGDSSLFFFGHHKFQHTKTRIFILVRPNTCRGFEVGASHTGLANKPIQSAMTISDNRRCPLQENTPRQTKAREMLGSNLPSPTAADPSRASSVTANGIRDMFSEFPSQRGEMRPKYVVIKAARPETQPQSDRTHHTARY